MSTTKEQQTIDGIYLSDLVFSILGDDQDGKEKAPIAYDLAVKINPYLQGSSLWRIIFEDESGQAYKYPILWRYKEWYQSDLRYKKIKLYSEKQRIERWILEANVSALTRVLMKSCSLDEKFARPTALTLIKTGNMQLLTTMGLSKFITTGEEL
jgi:hypothetical protein